MHQGVPAHRLSGFSRKIAPARFDCLVTGAPEIREFCSFLINEGGAVVDVEKVAGHGGPADDPLPYRHNHGCALI